MLYPDTFPGAKLRERRRQFRTDNRGLIAIAFRCSVVAAVTVAILARGVTIPLWALALLPFGMLCVCPEIFDGTYYLVRGRDAERWTRAQLKKLRSEGWSLFGPLTLNGSDVDHVVVGPGGIYAIETKYTDSDRIRDRDITRWVDQVERGARSVRLLLKTFGVCAEVKPLIVVWADRSTVVPQGWGHVPIRRAGDALDFFGSQLTAGDADLSSRIGAALQDFAAVQRRHERAGSSGAARMRTRSRDVRS